MWTFETCSSVGSLAWEEPMMTGRYGVFINYRRSDASRMAQQLYDKLVAEFGLGRVFMDIDSISLGVDFDQKLAHSLSQCKAQLVVIGDRWLTAEDKYGARRLDNPNDYVRMEIEFALRRDMLVIPILVDGASMPPPSDLPGQLRALARRNGESISRTRFDTDCMKLMRVINGILRDGDASQEEVIDPDEFNREVSKVVRRTFLDLLSIKARFMTHGEGPLGTFECDIVDPDNALRRIEFITSTTWPYPGRVGPQVGRSTGPSYDWLLSTLQARKAPGLVITSTPAELDMVGRISNEHPLPVRFLHWTRTNTDLAELEEYLPVLWNAAGK
jgi:hypothetical protein